MSGQEEIPSPVSLTTIVREWGRIGCIGFGGPPTHIKLLRELCVEGRTWMDAQEFEDAIAACNLLPARRDRLRGDARSLAGAGCCWAAD
jgi:chromate transporter